MGLWTLQKFKEKMTAVAAAMKEKEQAYLVRRGLIVARLTLCV